MASGVELVVLGEHRRAPGTEHLREVRAKAYGPSPPAHGFP
jgi:hypothetical protein